MVKELDLEDDTATIVFDTSTGDILSIKVDSSWAQDFLTVDLSVDDSATKWALAKAQRAADKWIAENPREKEYEKDEAS